MISALRFSARLRTSSSEVIFSASSWALRMMRSLSLRASSSIAWRSLTIQRACLSSSGIVWRIWSIMSKAASRSIIAVLPKPGKLRASSTSSSNLSISTSTSIVDNLILRLRSLLPGKGHKEPLHHLDGDILYVAGDLLYEPRSLYSWQSRLLAQVASDGDHNVVEDLGGAPYDIQVPHGHRVKASGTDGHDHC